MSIERKIDDSTNDKIRGHYAEEIAVKDKEIEALNELIRIAMQDDRDTVSREDIDQYIVMMQDM